MSQRFQSLEQLTGPPLRLPPVQEGPTQLRIRGARFNMG